MLNYLEQFQWQQEFIEVFHHQLMALFREFLVVGGMPGAVNCWVEESSLSLVNQIHHDLMTTYRDDFPKYRGRIESEQLEEVMMAIPQMLGKKFMYRRVDPSSSTVSIKKALSLLEKAKICTRIYSSAANGVPLGAEIRSKFFKVLFLDVGMSNASLGLTLNQLNALADLSHVQEGGVAEQVVGQLLKTVLPPYVEPRSYYWHRNEPGSHAEIDYVIQHGNQVIPIEVKAGSAGKLRSLHRFIGLKQLSRAVRINGHRPIQEQIEVKDHTGVSIRYTLLSLPFYLIGQIHRLLQQQE